MISKNMKKNRIITMSLREIKKSQKRFFSLCVLSILGVSFFVGMKLSGPTMLETLDKYYDDNKIYDLKIISTLGLEDEDIHEIQKLNNKYIVVGSHTKDAIFNDGKHESVLRMHEINNNINNILIIEGRMPEKYNEIVVEDGFKYKTNYKIGDKIKLKLEDDDTEIKTDELEIVGLAISPEYLNNNEITQSRGNTSLGNGQVAYYSYVSKDLFNLEYYTEIYVLDNDATKYKTTTKDYLKIIDEDEKLIDTIKEIRQKDRYTNFIEDANNKIKEKEEKINIELDNAKKQLDQYKIELDNGKRELDNAKRELDNANAQIQQGNKKLKESKEELTKGYQKLNDGKKEIEDKIKDYDITYEKLADFVKKYDSSSFSINDIVILFSNDNIDIKDTIENSLVNIKTVANSYGIDLEDMFNRYGINAENILNAMDIKAGQKAADNILKNDAIRMLFIKIITILETAKIDKMLTNVDFLSNLENSIGVNNPKIAIANVKELTYNPEIEMDVLKNCEISEIIPIMLKGVLIPKEESINIYKSSFGLFFIKNRYQMKQYKKVCKKSKKRNRD